MVLPMVYRVSSIILFILFVFIPSLALAFILIARDLLLQLFSLLRSYFNHSKASIEACNKSNRSLHPGNNNALMNSKVSELAKPLLTNVISQNASGLYSMESFATSDHLLGIPRRLVLSTVGAFSFIVTSVLNRCKIYNGEKLFELIHSRPPNTPLITVSNHMSTLDDPLLWGIRGLRATDPKLCRWTLTAKDICFTNKYSSYFFRVGKSIPVVRGGGINQSCIFEAIDKINQGEWLHTFPEGKVVQEYGPLRRLKWGVASIIARAKNPPIVLCIAHSGFEKVMPEKHLFGKRAFLPLWFNKISIVVGEPMQFDIEKLRKEAEVAVMNGDNNFGKDAIVHESDYDVAGSSAEDDFVYAGLDSSKQNHNDIGECVEDVEMGNSRVDGEVNPTAMNKVLSAISEGEMSVEEKRKRVMKVGCRATRRLYAEISNRIKEELEKLVIQAHAYNK